MRASDRSTTHNVQVVHKLELCLDAMPRLPTPSPPAAMRVDRGVGVAHVLPLLLLLLHALPGVRRDQIDHPAMAEAGHFPPGNSRRRGICSARV